MPLPIKQLYMLPDVHKQIDKFQQILVMYCKTQKYQILLQIIGPSGSYEFQLSSPKHIGWLVGVKSLGFCLKTRSCIFLPNI